MPVFLFFFQCGFYCARERGLFVVPRSGSSGLIANHVKPGSVYLAKIQAYTLERCSHASELVSFWRIIITEL